MAELNETKSPEKDDLGKKNESTELGKAANEADQLSEEQLNEPVDEVEGKVLASCDCRSECKYNTGYTHKYSNYGYSG